MPVPKPPKLTGKNGKAFTLAIDEFKKGTITLLDPSRIPQDGVYQSENMMLGQDGVWQTRYGSEQYGVSLTGPIDGMGKATVYNDDGTYNNYLFVIDDGVLKYCQNAGSWTAITGNTWTTGYPAELLQINNNLYITNGKDNMCYLDLGTFKIVTYTALSDPASPTLTASSSLTSGTTGFEVYYKITAVNNSVGETAASPEAKVAINKSRDNWINGTDSITLTWTAITNADSYNIYYGTQSGQDYFLASVSGTTYIDNGNDVPNGYQIAPSVNGTGSYPFQVSRWSGNRPWFCGDPATPYRVWVGAANSNLGSLNPFYGATYSDLNLGSDEKVVDVQHYRNGQGTQIAVVFTSSPSGGGSVWFLTLGSITVNNNTLTVISALPQGTIGTTSVRGQVQAYNNIYYPSIKGFQSLGSAPNIINVLMTTDISAIIRPSVQGINAAAADQICGIYYYGRVYYSVPYGSSTNNQIWVLDLERQAWTIPWTIGVKQFLDYADSEGTLHLLAIPVSGNNLIEFSKELTGDSGQPFDTNLQSGLIYWDKNHFQFAWVQKIYVELGKPKGNIVFSVSGTAPNANLVELSTISVTNLTSSSGYGEDQWGTAQWGTSAEVPQAYAEESVKKVIYVNKILNNLQWQITSSDGSQSWTLLEVGIEGNIIPIGDPSSWRQ